MKIKRLDFRSLRNNEHFQCQTEFKILVEEYDPLVLKIQSLYQGSYLPFYALEDEAIFKITKGSYTEARLEADRQRDSAFRGMIYANMAALHHFDTEVVASAKRLQILFDTYGDISRMPLQEEISAVYNLLQELDGDYNEDMYRVKLEDWKDRLQQNNDAYQVLVKQGYEEEAGRTGPKMKEVRLEVDRVFRQIVERLEALMLIEGESNYIGFVSRLNIQLEHYADILAQREGRNAAEEGEE